MREIMTGYERCHTALQWGIPDRVPVVPQNSDMAIYLSGYGMQECLYNPEKLAFALLEAQERMQYDGILLGPDAAILAEALGCETVYREDDPPAIVNHILSDLSDVDQLHEIDLSKNKRINTWLEATRIILEKTKGKVFVICRADQGAFSLATLLRGSQEMMLDLALGENIPGIMKLLDFCNKIHIQFARMIRATGAHATTCGDAYCGPGLISPEMYMQYALSYQQQAVQQITKEMGLPYSIHICGTTDQIHDLWIKSDATFFEIDHCTDIVGLRKKTLGKIALLGNLDTALLCLGTPEEVKEKCKELFTCMFPSSGFILSSGCSMSANTKVENVLAMVEASREFGIYQK
jgi:MtaA/CmuA family methyltransferase